MVNLMQQRHQTIMEPSHGAPVLMSHDNKRLQSHQQQQMHQQQILQHHLSPKSLENKDRDDKSYKRDRTRSKSRDRRSKSSRSGGGRRDRSRSRDRRRRDRSRGRDRSRDRHHNDNRSRDSSSRGSLNRLHRSRSPVGKLIVDGSGGDNKLTVGGEHQMQINPWTCQFNNLQQQQISAGVPMVGDNNHQQSPMTPMFNQFRTPPQPPMINVTQPNPYQQPQQPPNNDWAEHQQSYMLSNDFVNRPVDLENHYGANAGIDDDEDDRQAEFDNNFHSRCNDNNGQAARRGPPGQDLHVSQQGFSRSKFSKRSGGVQQHRGGKRSYEEFGGGSGGPRFNNHQQQQQPPTSRYGNFPDRGGRQSRFSSVQDTGGSKLNAGPPHHRDDGADSEDPTDNQPRFNDRYRYDIRNTSTSQQFDGLCVKVYNKCNPFSYGDIRLVFEGIHIDGSAIKIQKNRQGVAFVRFDNNHSKNLALRVNGNMYKGSPVSVKHLDDEAYERENTDDRPYPPKVPPTIVDHVDLVDDDEDEDEEDRPPAKADDNNELLDEGQEQQKINSDGGDGSDDGDGDGDGSLVVCEKTANDTPATVSKEDDVAEDVTTSPTTQQQHNEAAPTRYLKLNQLPIAVSEEDVMNEFDGGSNVRRVVFYPDGDFKGGALEFTNVEEAEAALKRFVCVLLGSTPVPVLRCTYKEFAQIKRKSEAGGRRFSGEGGSRHHHHNHHHNNHHHNPHNPAPPLQSIMMQPPRPPPPHNMPPVLRSSNCVYVYGLPTTITNTDITQFFADISVLPDKIHIMLSKMGRPTGESYCEFSNPQQAHAALAKDQCFFGPNLVYVVLIGRAEMIQAITKPMQQHNHQQDISWTGGMRGGGGPPRHNQQQNMNPPSVRHQGPQQTVYGGRGGGHNGQFGGNRAQQQYMNNGGGGGYTPRMRGPGPGPGGPNTGPDGFGQPGCVIALDNVPYRADVQEIVDFFEGFELSSQNVIRRFNDFGKPTGEARVNLRSPQEAGQAVRNLQNKPIFNRPVRLSLL